MTDKSSKKFQGDLHQGADHSAPYPVSRTAPAIELVDLAKEIATADTMLHTRTSSKLKVIADQIKQLQDLARTVLEEAQAEKVLHHAQCNFKKIPGKIYYLYEKEHDQLYFSMLSPNDWKSNAPHRYLGSYRLNADYSWERIDDKN